MHKHEWKTYVLNANKIHQKHLIPVVLPRFQRLKLMISCAYSILLHFSQATDVLRYVGLICKAAVVH
jgi:hypothetical protein